MRTPREMNSQPTLRRLCNRLIYALLALVAVVILMRAFGTQSLVGSPLGFVLGAVGIASGITYLLAVYRLSKEMSQSSGTAWLMLCLQIIPVIGLPAAIALLIKANAAAAKQELAKALPGTQSSGPRDA